MKAAAALAAALLLAGCSHAPEPAPAAPAAPAPDPRFGAYWYQDEAEITSYRLDQARYGEMRSGSAVLVFVTEDFSRTKEVKLDDPAAAGDDAVKVLKLNLIKKFVTGIYAYSMMTSVFTPIDLAAEPRTLKVTTTSQEWCGQTFTQLNLVPDAYRVRAFSYFESEGDRDFAIDPALLEDEIWTRIRIDPDSLPTGEIELVPGTMTQRLRHTPIEVAPAEASREDGGDGTTVYRISYRDDDHVLAIRYRTEFPHEIEGWEETYVDPFAEEPRRLTTRAVKDRRVLLDYWRHHGTDDVHWREELGLDAR